MSKKLSAAHNKLVTEFIEKVIREIIANDGTLEDVLVVLESVVFGIMLLLTGYYKMPPANSVAYTEEIINEAVTRFAATQNKPTNNPGKTRR